LLKLFEKPEKRSPGLIYCGDCRDLVGLIGLDSIDIEFFSDEE
jgi:hypothetical protein